MSAASRVLKVGDKVTTDFSKRITKHTIAARRDDINTSSRIAFKVVPIVPGSTGDWMCADWFEPAPTTPLPGA